MKYLLQFGVILAVSFAGELLKYFIPLPVPASIYGLILMLLLLVSGFVKLDMVENAADFAEIFGGIAAGETVTAEIVRNQRTEKIVFAK